MSKKGGIRKTGNWKGVKKTINKMGRTFERHSKDDLKDIVTFGEKIAVKYLRDQSLSWRPLSSDYLQQKASRGESTKILIASSQYLQSITSKINGGTGFVGVLRSARRSDDDGQPMVNLARVHEFGSTSQNIPARKLWLPVGRRMWSKWKKLRVEENIKKDIDR